MDDNLEVTFFVENDSIVAITSNKRLLVEQPSRSVTTMRKTRFLPPYIRLAKDKKGRLIVPEFSVTAVVERRDVWRKLLGNIDAVTWAIISCKMVYPRRQWVLWGSWLKNHPLWEVPQVKLKLGLKLGAYLFQGALEVVLWGCRLPITIEPLDAVSKEGPDEFRAISDARKGNKGLNEWGVRYFQPENLQNSWTGVTLCLGAIFATPITWLRLLAALVSWYGVEGSWVSRTFLATSRARSLRRTNVKIATMINMAQRRPSSSRKIRLSQTSLSSGDGVSANDLCGVGAFTWDAAQKRAGGRVTSQRMALKPTDVS